MATKEILGLLKKDHDTVRGMLEELDETDDGNERADLLADIKREVLVHAKVEEELFYPAVKKEAEEKEDRVMVLEAREEHALVEKVFADIEKEDPSSEAFEAKMHVLREIIEHHADEEEQELFPRVRELMNEKQRQELATQVEARKVELEEMLEEELEAM